MAFLHLFACLLRVPAVWLPTFKALGCHPFHQDCSPQRFLTPKSKHPTPNKQRSHREFASVPIFTNCNSFITFFFFSKYYFFIFLLHTSTHENQRKTELYELNQLHLVFVTFVPNGFTSPTRQDWSNMIEHAVPRVAAHCLYASGQEQLASRQWWEWDPASQQTTPSGPPVWRVTVNWNRL